MKKFIFMFLHLKERFKHLNKFRNLLIRINILLNMMEELGN